MSIFQVYNRDTRAVVLETDDWALAQHRALKWPLCVRGTHPSHEWGPPREGQGDRYTRRCRNCNGWDNGSYGSQSPCDYDWSHDSLVSALKREMANGSHPEPEGLTVCPGGSASRRPTG